MGIVRNGVLVSHQKSTPDTLVWKTGAVFPTEMPIVLLVLHL